MKSREIRKMLTKKPSWSGDGVKFWTCDDFNGGTTWIGQFSGQSPWEMHPDGDELLHILKGKVEITLMMGKRPKKTMVPAGSVFIVPKGHWHRQRALSPVTEFGATSGGTHYSENENPI
jgi:quercetin dioxygenase-like cupin family protein